MMELPKSQKYKFSNFSLIPLQCIHYTIYKNYKENIWNNCIILHTLPRKYNNSIYASWSVTIIKERGLLEFRIIVSMSRSILNRNMCRRWNFQNLKMKNSIVIICLLFTMFLIINIWSYYLNNLNMKYIYKFWHAHTISNL